MLENAAQRINFYNPQPASLRIQSRVSNSAIDIRHRHIRNRYFRPQQAQKHLVHYVFSRRGIRHETTRIRHQRRPVLVIESPHVLGAQFSFRQMFRPGRVTICTYDTPARQNCLCPANLAAVFVFGHKEHTAPMKTSQHANSVLCTFALGRTRFTLSDFGRVPCSRTFLDALYLPSGVDMLTLRLPPSIEKRLEKLARRTGRTKTYYVREAILTHLADLEDLYLAESTLERIRSGEEQTIPLKDVMTRHGLEG